MSALPEMPCAEFVECVTDYLEGALDPAGAARLEAHLAACPPCGEYLAQLRATLRACGQLRDDDVAPAMRAHLAAAFAAWKAERGGAG